jgi:hypothetical protein
MRGQGKYFERRRHELELSAPAAIQHVLSHMVGDAVGGGMAFLISQLAFVEAQIYERKYLPLVYQKLMTISTEGGPGVTSFLYRVTDVVGQGKRISNSADDIPYVNAIYDERVVPVVLGGVGYEYSTEELRQSAMLNIPLPSNKARIALRAYENHMNKVALVGEGNDLKGLLNYPGVPVIPPKAPWTAATVWNDILTDVNGLLGAIYIASAENDYANTLLVPPSVLQLWMNTYQPYTGESVLELITENNFTTVSGGGPLLIQQVAQLETQSASGHRRVVAYNRSEDNVVMHIPMPLNFLAPQPKNLELRIPGEYKYGGCEVRYMCDIRYMEDV